MGPKIFAIGTTGYLGGDILYLLLQTNPALKFDITCLARSPDSGKNLSSAYPGIRVVYSTLEDSEVLEDEASKADIVLSVANCDHVGAHAALKKGLEKGKGGIWVHASGTDILLPPAKEGSLSKKKEVYDDWDGVGDCITIPETHSHGPVDQIVLSTASPKVKTAIVCPPTIWGLGRGPGNTRSHQIYELASLTLSRGSGIQLPPPLADKLFWPLCHVHDVSKVFFEILQDAIGEIEGKKGRATWDKEGYYFCVEGRFYWQEVAGWIAEEAMKQGLIKIGGMTTMREDEQKDLDRVGPALWNLASDCKSIRAEKLFGWTPMKGDLNGEIPAIVSSEARRLGLSKSF
ncbi:hypothetical protein B0O99DRAFT_733673 [Bisporella sp. PMI_857]|nr:hypothetical protein B0O99DRAFT_733673 [Bisporella sp. PMI_857]